MVDQMVKIATWWRLATSPARLSLSTFDSVRPQDDLALDLRRRWWEVRGAKGEGSQGARVRERDGKRGKREREMILM